MNGKPVRTQRGAGAGELPHLIIENVTPVVDDGRYAAKRIIGDLCVVGADIFKDGHDLIAARVRYRGPGDAGWRYIPLTYEFGADRWFGELTLDRIGRWTYTVEAWTDAFGSWRGALEKKVGAGQDVSLELLEGAVLIETAARRTRFGNERTALTKAAQFLRTPDALLAERTRAALAPELLALMRTHWAPADLTTYRHELALQVDRERAGFAAWYELFPRSMSREPGRHGTFADAEQALPRLAELGFDVVYLPPIHPIGKTFRKGPNNTLHARPGDPGSPWAIGSEEGGHTAVDPNLGTIDDFDRFVARAAELGLEVALDYALQCSPDHPWVKEHPNWFTIRPDGTIQYAENPPKKYQDIYPINFWTSDRQALWEACRDVLLFWIGHGVKTFRVDNPHTKPFAFWEWCLAEVQREHPDVVFLSEAFTRPKKLLNLAKLGFTQSYTYFTWKNTAPEIRDWLAEFQRPDVLEYYRGNYFANTPDILHEYLQQGGRPAFRVRLLLAATLGPLYGIYSGFELAENVPVRPGSEEYLDSEKYQIRQRDFAAPGNLDDDIRCINRLRRGYHALQRAGNLTFVPSENDAILCYLRAGGAPIDRGPTGPAPTMGAGRSSADGASDASLLIGVNLDPRNVQATMVHVPLAALGIDEGAPYVVHDLLTGARYTWRGARNYMRLDPAEQPGHVFRIER